jgi:nitrite reductase/ring-hydroxylating ferredoxin subunit
VVSAAAPPLRVIEDPRRIGEGQAAAFRIAVDGIEHDAFVVRWRGALHAWLNVCRHQQRRLDFGDLHFFDDEYDALVCCHHGARYRPDTGACVAGPCEGAGLTPLALETRADGLWCLGRARAPGSGRSRG